MEGGTRAGREERGGGGGGGGGHGGKTGCRQNRRDRGPRMKCMDGFVQDGSCHRHFLFTVNDYSTVFVKTVVWLPFKCAVCTCFTICITTVYVNFQDVPPGSKALLPGVSRNLYGLHEMTPAVSRP